jgi:HD-GYP domain-containing protein (c-di-GMP phosphodiesterase class II)
MGDAAELMYSEFEFLAVPTGSLLNRKVSITDLYVKLPTGRMIKIAHRGGAINLEQIQRLGDKNVQHFYVYRADFAAVVQELVRGAQALNQMQNVPTDLKVSKFFSIAESVYVEMLRLPISEDSFMRALQISQEISISMRDNPQFATLVKTLVGMGDEFARHSLGCVVMSRLIMGQLDWSSPKLMEPVNIGAFFHDIGLRIIPEDLRFKEPIEMTAEERLMWETHPAKGALILEETKFANKEVLRIVQEHHEIPNGQGFPGKLSKDRIFPMAKVVSLGNVMAHDIFDSLLRGTPFSVEVMLHKIENDYAPMYGSDLSRAAKRIFKKDDK